jgi:pyruvate/2-oxoglutarate/acetoin dehydrogenase E1 component|tara:strand:- start:5322 stop:5873 length:552 start_codon:yes stop_codon:yes gene_type:complete
MVTFETGTDMNDYKKEVFRGMELLGQHPKTIFMGQAIEYKGTALTHQVKNFPSEKLLELPVAEEFQAGIALGLALEGYIPVSMYPRMNFIILAMNQIVNHLDKWEAMSVGQSKPKVIMKAVVGSQYPLDPGHQHKANFTQSFKSACTNIDVVELLYPEEIYAAYEKALYGNKSTLIVEHGDLY